MMAYLVGSVSGRPIPITKNPCLWSQRLLSSRASTSIRNNNIAPVVQSICGHGSSSIHTFKAKAMIREEPERRFPPQHQHGQPGKEYLMDPRPIFSNPDYKPTNKLKGKVALVTGGDSGIGRSVCYFFAKEGATVAFTYVKGVEDIDAKYTLEIINDAKMSDAGDPIAIPTDVRYDKRCKKVVDEVVAKYGRIDVLVNNAAVQYNAYTLDDITEERLERIFRTNIFSHFFMTRHAVKHMKPGSSIINTTSVLGFSGSPKFIDYASTKGAIVNFTKSLAIFLIDKKIRVNGVAPGPIWTPLEAAALDDEDIASLGSQAPMNRAGQPFEVGLTYVFLASNDASYYTGTFLHPDGGLLDNNAIPRVNNNQNTENP
ncbi:glucose and ribitol dehydrogenase [Lactuca sativa]|uniref:Glucose/ribitol dehydrogenase n=1 Tax=Lactuca sativa TaxID=4236 RepID=A0A9R1VK29_LACSA|nr:glucose and ribitol dehydrogenase [Lactuca sativa]KAJ0206774.1 hypothetical protein LSAT_V11C500260920 [Lactuca sativa]